MGGIGQNILRELREDGDLVYTSPKVEKLLKGLNKKNKKKRKVNEQEK